MKTDREKLIEEAVARMEIIGLSKSIINQFLENNNVFVSCEPNGLMIQIDEYDVENNEFIDSFEDENNCLVYLIIKGIYNIKTNVGSIIPEYLDNVFFIKLDEENLWQAQREELKNKLANVYIRDVEYLHCSSFGTIEFKKNGSGVARTDVPLGEDINGRLDDFIGVTEEEFLKF